MEQEQLRHQYLDAIGVASWLPRAALPGAGSSANWVDDFQYPAPEIPFVSERTVSARAGLSDSRQGMKTEAPAVKASASAGVAAARAALGVQPEASPEIEALRQRLLMYLPFMTSLQRLLSRFLLRLQNLRNL